MKTGDVAARLGVSDNTVRNWSGEYEQFLSELGAGVQPGATREFTEDDLLVLATVKKHRDMGLTHEQIIEVLEKGTRESLIPPAPQSNEERIRESLELTTRDRAEIEILRSQLGILQQRVAQVIKERDEAVTAERSSRRQIDELHQQIHDLERTIGDVKAEAARMEERSGRIPELETLIEQLRRELEEAKDRRRGPFGLW